MKMPRSTITGLSLRDLEYALAVAETGHFGRAARHCGVSQPALSEQIRKLEALLGIALFERGGKGARPTPQGQGLLNQAGRVLAEAHGLLEMAAVSAEPLAGPLRLGAIQSLGPYYLPHALRQIRQAYPRVGLRLSEGLTAALIDDLRAGALDAILAAEPLPAEGLTTAALFFEPFMLACPADHRLAGLAAPRLRDLAADDLILLEEGHCLRDQALSLCAVTPPPGRQATSVETLWHMIAAGEGFSLLPALSLAGRDGMEGLVTCRRLPDPAAGRVIALAWRATDPRGADLRAVAALLRQTPPADVTRIGLGRIDN